MTTEIKLIAGAVALIALLVLGWWIHHAIYAAGDTAGSARIQALWDADKKAISDLATQAQAKADAAEKAASAANQEIIDGLQSKLASSESDGLQLARSLRNAQARLATGGSNLPQSPGGPGIAPARGASSDDAITAALGATLAECTRNADRLDALNAELGPQL